MEGIIKAKKPDGISKRINTGRDKSLNTECWHAAPWSLKRNREDENQDKTVLEAKQYFRG